VLDVARSASSRDIRAAYLRLSRQHHPDKSDAPDAAERFAAVANAYEARPAPHCVCVPGVLTRVWRS
jgi:DnaJ-class molecular chaperone